MIVGLEGEIIDKTPISLWIKCYGVVYEVFVPLHLLSFKTSQIQLFTTQITREEGVFLYGFLERAEKTFFDRIIRINGIGPKIALAILSTYHPQEFMRLVQMQDTKALQRVPGIGSKGVHRIMVELGDFSLDFGVGMTQSTKEARLALESLGFKSDKIQKVLSEIQTQDVSEIIKEALKKLS